MKPTREQIERLPKWASDYIARIEGERDIAIAALNSYVDEQTESPVFIDEYESTGETAGPTIKRRYIQTRRVRIEWFGIELDLLLAQENDPQRFPGICLSWHAKGDPMGVVGLVPMSFGGMQLVHPKHMKR